MRHLLLIIGAELRLHANYLESITRAYVESAGELNERICIDKASKELPFFLEAWIKEYDYITIFSSPTLHSICAKTLATLAEDSLEIKQNSLVPLKATQIAKDSFLMQIKQCKINLLKATINAKIPQILQKFKANFAHFCLHSIDEESANLLLQTLAKSYKIDILSSALLENLVLVRISGAQKSTINSFLQGAENLFRQKFIPGTDIINFVAQKLIKAQLKISFAESCTAGLFAAEFAKNEGISAIFEGSLITYSNRLKHEWLGISEIVLQNEYSEKCVYFMLKGAFKTSDCDFALAISGVAGNEDDKGVKAGTLYIGAMYKDGAFLQETMRLEGERNFVRKQAVLGAFMLLLKLKPEIFF